MSELLRLYYHPLSRARIAHWALEEVGVPYELKLVDFAKGEERRPEFLAINPMGKVPALVHRDTVVTECAAILAYLGDAFPAAKLAPPLEHPSRGTYLRWLFFVQGCFEAAVLEKHAPRVQPVPPSRLGFGSYDDVLNTCEQALAPGPFLLGDAFTMADLLLASQLGWSLFMQQIEPRPAFVRYVELCQARPASRRASDQAEALVAQVKNGK